MTFVPQIPEPDGETSVLRPYQQVPATNPYPGILWVVTGVAAVAAIVLYITAGVIYGDANGYSLDGSATSLLAAGNVFAAANTFAIVTGVLLAASLVVGAFRWTAED